MSDATIEVDGEVYTLTNPTYYAGEAIEGMTQTGRRITGLRGEPFIEASVSGWEFATVVIRNNDPREAIPCRVTMGGGVVFTARACAVEWSPNPPVTQLRIENLVAIPAAPAAPTLDELTDPADLDWGTIRSTCAARDWRAAWGVVGTDHAGAATPGEVYLLSVARHKSATAAALKAWCNVAMLLNTRGENLGASRATRTLLKGQLQQDSRWQRIKRIAAWESSARAQYDERGNRRGRLQAAMRDWREEFADTTVRPTNMWIDEATLNALRQQAAVIDDPVTITPEWAASHDRLADLLQAAMPAGLSLGYRTAEDDAVTRGNGGVPGVLNNLFLTAIANRGDALRDLTARAAATTRALAAVGAATIETSRQIDAMTRSINPAPRGPQTKRRR